MNNFYLEVIKLEYKIYQSKYKGAQVDAAIGEVAGKASQEYVDTNFAKKEELATLTQQLDGKADTETVSTLTQQVASKASQEYVDTNFVLKSAIVKLTQSEYNALTTKDPNTIYLIVR